MLAPGTMPESIAARDSPREARRHGTAGTRGRVSWMWDSSPVRYCGTRGERLGVRIDHVFLFNSTFHLQAYSKRLTLIKLPFT